MAYLLLMCVGDQENGPKPNQGGSVGDRAMRKNVLKEDIDAPRWR